MTIGQPIREVSQTILYDPELNARGVFGNCIQAAMASALGLDLDAVPHFGAFVWWDAAARLWLRGRCLDWHWVPVAHGLPEGRCLIIGQSPRRTTDRHAVAGDDGRIAWDPHPSRDGLTEIEGAYAFQRWPDGSDRDGFCVCCAGQISALAATREAGPG